MCWTEGWPGPGNGKSQSEKKPFPDRTSYLGIVKMNHCAIVLDHVHFLNAGDVVDCNARIKLRFFGGN